MCFWLIISNFAATGRVMRNLNLYTLVNLPILWMSGHGLLPKGFAWVLLWCTRVLRLCKVLWNRIGIYAGNSPHYLYICVTIQALRVCTKKNLSLNTLCRRTSTQWAVGCFSISSSALLSSSRCFTFFKVRVRSLDDWITIWVHYCCAICCSGISSGWDGFPISSAYENFVDGLHCSIGEEIRNSFVEIHSDPTIFKFKQINWWCTCNRHRPWFIRHKLWDCSHFL